MTSNNTSQLDRSLSTASGSSTASLSRAGSSSGAFAYQTKLLERTSSLSRTNSLSNRSIAPVPPTITRRWTPTHRVGTSMDSLRGRWEERTKLANELQQSSPPLPTVELPMSLPATPASAVRTSMDSLRGRWEERTKRDNELQHSSPPLPTVELPISLPATPASAPPTETRFRAMDLLIRDRPLPPTPAQTPVKRPTIPSFMSPSNTGSSSSSSSRHFSPPSPTASSFATPTPNRISLARNTPLESSSVSAVKRLSGYAIPSEPESPTPYSSRPITKPESPTPYSTRPITKPIPPTPSDSVMNPPQYRSSYLANKRQYGDSLGSRLGRHLPRIASGDGQDELDEPKKSKQPVGMTESMRRREKRQKQLDARRLWDDHGVLPSPPSSPTKPSATDGELIIPGITGADEVQGLRGRIRFSKQPRAAAAITPSPSARLTMGLWHDRQRHLLQAYEYLCHVGEAQQWMEGCLGWELGFGVVEMEEGLRNGVVMAKLARVWEGHDVVKKIYEHPKLGFRHSDNINYFLAFVRRVGLPESFIFELIDLYEKKNIPKVIYCIHALSHLLARRGMAQRIGNLLGRLEFSDDQLQQTQKGLTASGVPMPNFGNVGKELAKEINEEPEVEVETDDERRDRLLLEQEGSIIQLQARARGYLVRQAQHTLKARMRLAERYIPKIQARCRGFLVRRIVHQQRKSRSNLRFWAIALQAHARGVLTRNAVRRWLDRIRSTTRYIVRLQAQARGVLLRRRYAKLIAALRTSKFSTIKLQSIARARIVRKSHKQISKTLLHPQIIKSVVGLQAAARGVLERRNAARRWNALERVEYDIVGMQAHVRGVLVRRRVRNQLAKLDDSTDTVIRIQAAARAFLARKRLLTLIRGLRKATPLVVGLQAQARAKISKRKHKDLTKALGQVHVVKSVAGFQAFARAAITRNRHVEQAKRLEFCEPDMVKLQAAARGALLRNDYWAWRDHLHQSQAHATILQALLRGAIQRKKFHAKMKYYRANLTKVVKIQSLFRAKEQREQYRQLTLGKNVNVGTIKNFVHLLDDSEADFEDEIEVERLRKRVVEAIRENQALETDVSELDVKIGLVVQNVKSFEELMKARKRHGADSAAAHAARASVLAAHGDPFAGPNTLDQATRRKLEHYQHLFYLLQTRGEYLARLFFTLSRVSVEEKTKRLAERVVLTLFGYGQDRREDYLLLKMFQMSIHEEIKAAPSLADIMDGRSMYLSVALLYVRPKQLVFVREALQDVIRTVLEEDELDLETDPVVIYRARIDVEEMRSGQKSSKSKDISFHQAVTDPPTRTEFIQHLQKLQALTKDFVRSITSSTRKIPFGLRCIARETLLALRVKFPDVPDPVLASTIGKLIYYRYINPAIVTPETFDIVSTTLDAQQRHNLTEISKMLTQITSGVIFGDENPCLTPLNNYVADAIQQFGDWFLDVADVPDAEAYFHAHEFLDATVQPKPIYISPNEVYSMQKLLMQHLDAITLHRDDPLREILRDLGGVPNLGTDELNDARDRAITLELTSRFVTVDDPHADEKALWVQAKRCVLALLRVQPGKDLVEALMQPVTEEHEILWEDIVDSEMASERLRQRRRRMPSASGVETGYRLEDIQSLSFREVKAHAIFFLLELEKQGKLNRADGYQGILDAIAGDVRGKHRKRIQRKNEMDSMKGALKDLKKRKAYFEGQIDSYQKHVEAAMNTMQKGKSKKRSTIFNPFSRQANHLRELMRSGKSMPQYGSFKYSAQELYDRGILLSIDQSSPRQFDRIDIVISSNAPGLFVIEATNVNHHDPQLIGRSELKMEDLLQAQFENRVSLPLFDGKAKMNLNTLLYQINKKFYV